DLRQPDGRPARHEREAHGPQRTHRRRSLRHLPRGRARRARRRRRWREARDRHVQVRRESRGSGAPARRSGRRASDHHRRAAVSELYVGLMSGTSLDGITAAVASFTENRADLVCSITRSYSAEQRKRIEHMIAGPSVAAEWAQLDVDLGAWLAEAALSVIAKSGVPKGEIRAIGSHGQTVWHEPGRATWQMGQAAVIAECTGIDVISDFRVRDVAAGGQGAPLVTLADALLFRAPQGVRALQNLGGIGNVT